MISTNIFRSYDIRGNSNSNLKPSDAYKIGYCFGKLNITHVNNTIYIGRDGRLSSPSLFNALACGLVDAGAKLTSIGVVPTPLLYFADKKFKPAASIMITGSHNPKDDNGFKMVTGGKPFFGDQIQDLLKNIIDSNLVDVELRSNLSIEEIDINQIYVDEILAKITVNTNLKVAWDPGNGAACNVTNMLQQNLPNTNIIINGEIDGNFPAHHPDPTVPENLAQLIELIRLENCDFGIAFDGDADRIGIVTSKAEILWGDQMLCLFAKDILTSNPGATIIADVKASQVVFDQVEQYGGVPLMWKTGHSHIKTKILETGAVLAGEMSGHIFFADNYYGYDDAIYAALRFIDLISRSSVSLDAMLRNLPVVYNTPEIRIETTDTAKFKIIDQIKDKLSQEQIAFNDIDGLRVNTENGWWLLRASNTQSAIIARCESVSKQGLDQLKSNLAKLLLEYDLKLESSSH